MPTHAYVETKVMYTFVHLYNIIVTWELHSSFLVCGLFAAKLMISVLLRVKPPPHVSSDFLESVRR
jgi:hypothetical protein